MDKILTVPVWAADDSGFTWQSGDAMSLMRTLLGPYPGYGEPKTEVLGSSSHIAWRMLETEPDGQWPRDNEGNPPDYLARWLTYCREVGKGGLLLGANQHEFVFAAKNTNLLHIGPPQTPLGKTASGIIPNVISWNGPVVLVTTKGRTVPAVAMVRARFGTVWAMDVDGRGLNPGYRAIRFSPLEEIKRSSDDPDEQYSYARDLADFAVAAADTAKTSGSENSQYFRQRATALLGILMVSCVQAGRDMNGLMGLLRKPQGKAGAGGSKSSPFSEIVKTLKDREEEGHTGCKRIAEILDYETTERGDGRELHSIIGTALNAMAPFERKSVMELTKPDALGFFDFEKFVRGRPGENPILRGQTHRWDTIVIESETQAEVAPLVVMFLAAIRKAAANMMRDADKTTKRMERDGTPQSTLFALDELATMAPIPKLSEDMAKGRTGLVYLGAIQDPAQLEKFNEGDALMSLFQNVYIHPGIRNSKALEAISMLAGEYDHVQQDASSSKQIDREGNLTPTSGTSTSTSLRRVLPVGTVANGHPGLPSYRLVLKHGSSEPDWVGATPWWKMSPFQQIVIQAFAFWSTRRDKTGWMLPPAELMKDGKLPNSLHPSEQEIFEQALELWRADFEGDKKE